MIGIGWVKVWPVAYDIWIAAELIWLASNLSVGITLIDTVVFFGDFLEVAHLVSVKVHAVDTAEEDGNGEPLKSTKPSDRDQKLVEIVVDPFLFKSMGLLILVFFSLIRTFS